MAEEIHLGFSIDTTGLKAASVAAKAAAEDISKVGDAERKQAEASAAAAKAAQILADSLQAEQRAADTLKKQIQSLDAALKTGTITNEQHSASVTALSKNRSAWVNENRNATKAAMDAATSTASYGDQLKNLSGTLSVSKEHIANLVEAIASRGGSGGLGGVMGAVGESFGHFKEILGGTGAAALITGGTIVGLGLAFYEGSKHLAHYQDQLAQVESRLKLMLGSDGAAKQAITDIYNLTQKTGTGFEQAVEGFQQVARINDSLGLTSKQLLQVTSTIQKASAMSGSSPQQVQMGLMQLFQGLGSGNLQGQDLKALEHDLPSLGKIIAQNFERADGKIGVSFGALKQLGAQGELTSQKLIEALLRAKDQIDKDFEGTADTVEKENKRVEDSWDMLMAHLGQKWHSSEIVRGIRRLSGDMYKALDDAVRDPTVDEKITALRKKLQDGFEAYSTGDSVSISPLDSGARKSIQAEIDALLKQKTDASKEQAVADQATKTKAIFNNADKAAEGLHGLTEEARKAKAPLLQLQPALDEVNRLLALPNAQDDVAKYNDLLKQRTEILGQLGIVAANVAKVMSEYQKQQQAFNDKSKADSMGGLGGASIVMAAITQQRTDQSKGGARELSDYVALGLAKKIQDGKDALAALQRQAAQAEAKVSMVGASADATRAFEVEQEMVAKREQDIGTLGKHTKSVNDYYAAYRAQLERTKEAAQKLADAQRAQRSVEAAELQHQLLSAGLDPRSQARAQLEGKIKQSADTYVGGENSPQFQKDAAAQRQAFDDKEKLAQAQSSRAMDMKYSQLAQQANLVGLTTEEYQIQNALLQKQFELLAQGYTSADEYYKTELARTEMYERGMADQTRRLAQSKAIFAALNNGVAQFKGTFTAAFDDIFQYGVKKGGDTLLTGLGGIVRKIGADMLYELAVKPFEALAAQMASKLGQYIGTMLTMSGGSGATQAINYTPGGTGGNAANGAAFDGVTRFAMGGTFTNRVVDKPTLFAFANGTGLMGEAGPEAIMPLKRDSSGRLGVAAQQGGGSDGGMQVVINDMRTSSDSQPVQAKESRGANGKRVMSIMIRDEMRRQFRSGDMDRDMSSNFGTGRVLQRL